MVRFQTFATVAFIAAFFSITALEAQDKPERKSFKGLTSTQYQKTFTESIKQNYRPVKAKVTVEKDQPLFDVEFKKQSYYGGFTARHNLDDSTYLKFSRQMKAQGYKLYVHEVYFVKGTRLHLAYWTQPPATKLGEIWKPDSTVPAFGKTSRKFQVIDQTFKSYLKKHQLPGATVAISYRGKLIYERGFGYADIETKEAMKPNALMRIASVSKPITGAAIMQLVERGKLKLDDKVFEILDHQPRDPKKVDKRLKDITVRYLLNHAAGYDRKKSYDPMFKPYVMSKALKKKLPINTNDIIRYMMSEPLDFTPGERYAYSNYGYCLLGRVIEKVSGLSYEEYVKRNILKPVGVTRMKIGKTVEQDRATGEVKYYLRTQNYYPAVDGPEIGKFLKHQYGAFNVPIMDSHGAWIASARDLVKFASAFDKPESCPLMKADSVRQMFERPSYLKIKKNSKGVERYYAAGWSIVRWDRGLNSYHNGALPGTSTMLVRRHDGFNWAVLFNCRKTPRGKDAVSEMDGLMHRGTDAIKKNMDF